MTDLVCVRATQRLSVLETLGYINADGAVALKGRVAAEINTAEELLLTEMIFESVLGDLTPEEIVAVLSALVFQVWPSPVQTPAPRAVESLTLWYPCAAQGKTQVEPQLTKRLEDVRTSTIKVALSIGGVQVRSAPGVEGGRERHGNTLALLHHSPWSDELRLGHCARRVCA